MAADWKVVISTVAPSLGAALDGPLSDVAMTCIAKAIKIEESQELTEDLFAKVIKNLTPENLLAIKELDVEFESKMAALGLDLKKVILETAATATSAATEAVLRTTNKSAVLADGTVPKYLAIGAISMFFAVICVSCIMLFLPEGINKDAIYFLGAVQGASIGLIQTVYSYYLGNNSSSDAKDQMLYRSQPMSRKTDGAHPTNQAH